MLDTYTEPVPFPCDGEVLLAYELHITNMDRLTIGLASVEVFAEGIPTPVRTCSGELLAESLNRVRVEGQPDDVRQVVGGQRAILHVLLSYPKNVGLPTELTHRVGYSFLIGDGSEVGAVISGGTIRVAREREAPTIGAPLEEGIWLAGRGVSMGLSGHRGGAIRPQDGIPYQKARYAFDFVRFNDTGQAFTGERSRNEDWIGYGSQVLAVADATVITVQDGIPDSRPFDPDRLQSLTGETLAGNYIVLDIGNEIFAFYGHLQPGSVLVREGDRVRKGRVIGRVGNSGNSTLPHLHFQINRAIPIQGEAVPYVFEGYEYLGEAGSGWLSPDSATSEWVRALEKGGQPRVNEMPGAEAVIRFPKALLPSSAGAAGTDTNAERVDHADHEQGGFERDDRTVLVSAWVPDALRPISTGYRLSLRQRS